MNGGIGDCDTALIDGLDTRINGLETHLTAHIDDLRVAFTMEDVCYESCICCH
jgi:hypothetical protein